jgi:hypothetical protein
MSFVFKGYVHITIAVFVLLGASFAKPVHTSDLDPESILLHNAFLPREPRNGHGALS